MARTARRDNVRAIRPGLSIPTPRDEDIKAAMVARLAASYAETAYKLAQLVPDSEEHRLALHMSGVDKELPRNNLRLIVRPNAPRAEWLNEAMARVDVAAAAKNLADSKCALGRHLDLYDGNERRKALEADRKRTAKDYELAIADALRMPAVRKFDVGRKQTLVGKRAWALVYRPEWQAIIDEEMERFPSKARRAVSE